MDTTLASPGVTDNSSGNAACIELARIFNKFREKLRRNVKIAFWTSHETGRYSGSTWYNDVFWHDLRYNCIMSLCIEGPGAKGAYKWRNVTANELADHAIRCAKEVLGAEIGAGPGIGSRKSDGSFWGTGFPKCSIDSMQLPETADPFGSGSSCNWWWHTPWATIDKYDLNLLVETAKYYVKFIFNILNDPILPMSFRRAINAQLGFIERIQDEIEKISAHFNLNSLLDRMKEFRVQSDLLDETVNEILEKYKNASNDETFIPILEKLNNCFMWVGRHVNIVSHWNAKKTGQISMEEIGSQAYPSLIGGEGVPGVLDLGRMAFPTYGPKPDFYMLRTKLIRERNWVEDGYYLAIQTIKKTLRELKDMSENQKLACACGVIF